MSTLKLNFRGRFLDFCKKGDQNCRNNGLKSCVLPSEWGGGWSPLGSATSLPQLQHYSTVYTPNFSDHEELADWPIFNCVTESSNTPQVVQLSEQAPTHDVEFFIAIWHSTVALLEPLKLLLTEPQRLSLNYAATSHGQTDAWHVAVLSINPV